MIYTARNDHYEIFQFYCPIFYLACTLECFSYSIEEDIGWTSVHSYPRRDLVVHPQTIYQLRLIWVLVGLTFSEVGSAILGFHLVRKGSTKSLYGGTILSFRPALVASQQHSRSCNDV
jgi:hypothetical protein